MKRHLLLTISDDRSASYNLRFVGSFFERKDEVEMTLLYVAPRLESWRVDCRGACHEQPVIDRIEELKRTEGQTALDRAREWALQVGWEKDDVRTKVITGGCGTTCEIVGEGHRGLYDAVLFGRRGLSWIQEMFADSVSHKVLWEDTTFPIWVCRMPEEGRTDVLLCADGSEASLRMADHVGFMLAHEPAHKVTVLHVKDESAREVGRIDEILAQAAAMVTANGVEPERLSTRVVEWHSVSATVLALAEKESYAVVAIGRTGAKPRGLASRIFGTTSVNLLRETKRTTLWISR